MQLLYLPNLVRSWFADSPGDAGAAVSSFVLYYLTGGGLSVGLESDAIVYTRVSY